MTVRACIICATPRSGSTLLCDLLTGSGVAGRPASFYRQQSIPDLARRLGVADGGPYEGMDFDRTYLDAVVRDGTGKNGIFGLRLMWSSVAGLSRRIDGLFSKLPNDRTRFERAFGAITCLHLLRADRVAQAVSRLKAEQTGLWHVAADGSERERSAPPKPACYDARRLRTFVDEVAHDEAAWERWFSDNGITPVRLTYEELVADPGAALARVLSALALDPLLAGSVDVKTSRMADAESLAWTARYRAEQT